MAGGEGSVVYGENSDSSVYGGAYNNVTFNNAAVLNGDATIFGNAVLGANGSFTAQNGTVTYNGTNKQTVATGTYDNLTLTNGGTKVFEAGSESTVNGALNVQGSTAALAPMVSSITGKQYTLNFNQDNASFHYAYIDGLKVDGQMNLDGTNRIGNHNTGIDTFNAASGIGDMYPDMLNSNLSAVRFSLMSELMNAQMYETQLLEEFRRRKVVDTVRNTVSDIKLDSSENEDLLAEAGSMLDEAIRTLASSDMSVLPAELEGRDVVVASGVFQDSLDEALEAIIKE